MKKTFTIKDFANDLRISEKVARRRLNDMELNRKVMRVSDGYPIVYTTSFHTAKWHDPFNKCMRGDHEKIIDCVIASYVKRKSAISDGQ